MDVCQKRIAPAVIAKLAMQVRAHIGSNTVRGNHLRGSQPATLWMVAPPDSLTSLHISYHYISLCLLYYAFEVGNRIWLKAIISPHNNIEIRLDCPDRFI